ncbi:MAG: 3-phosphoshikimate 1-carboxyvinyltransferase [Candidatus Eremiobacteraeota bacterium]|nr:3-phosphoshikimate 1-carboxyvinyltransferase [Candidatus Eremiobacteraeota bacterium]
MVTFSPGPLRGEVRVPGDKSISHRALIVGTARSEPLRLENVNTGADVLATADALRSLGAVIDVTGTSASVHSTKLHDAAETLECRNSGSTARMVLGVCAGANLCARFDGDQSLRSRPMEPVAAQLRAFGALVETQNGCLPIEIAGTPQIQTRDFILLSQSAQVKSALIFAALFAKTAISITNDAGSRDHTERILEACGAKIRYDRHGVVFEPSELTLTPLQIPGDFSAAAFFIVGAAICPGSAITIRDVGVNPTRTGLLDALDAMGASISVFNQREWNNEPVADIEVKAAPLRGTEIGAEVAARALDEIPVLAVAAAYAEGVTRISALRRLREKESDRLAASVQTLQSVGVAAEQSPDEIVITGDSVRPADIQTIETHGDHRIAMAIAPLASLIGPLSIDDGDVLDVSFPNFPAAWKAAQSESSLA